MFVSGVGGTRKSFLIHAVKCPEMFSELQKEGKVFVCLFPTRKQCDQLNEQMLARLDCPKKELLRSDEVDKTKSSNKWHKKAVEQLDKLNKDCNNTAGLQAVVKVAVGARVMLRRNIDTKGGQVNGAIGTILSVSDRCISIKFDNANDPCDSE